MENPNSLQEEAPSVFTLIPSPLLGVVDDNTLLVPPHYQEINARGSGLIQTDNLINTDTTHPIPPPKKRSDGAIILPSPKKNTSTRKKDRHSKIRTAQGLRARRMRLSVQIARKFFDLQDMLGFDKASKTIEWLFAKSTSAIRELGSSEMEEAKDEASLEAPIIFNDNRKEKNSRKLAYSYVIGNKESRDKARARARERTRVKMFIRNLERSEQYYVEGRKLNDLDAANQLFSRSHEKNFQNNIRAVVSNGEDSSNNFLGILENWQMESERINSDYCALMTNMVPMKGNVHSLFLGWQ